MANDSARRYHELEKRKFRESDCAVRRIPGEKIKMGGRSSWIFISLWCEFPGQECLQSNGTGRVTWNARSGFDPCDHNPLDMPNCGPNASVCLGESFYPLVWSLCVFARASQSLCTRSLQLLEVDPGCDLHSMQWHFIQEIACALVAELVIKVAITNFGMDAAGNLAA